MGKDVRIVLIRPYRILRHLPVPGHQKFLNPLTVALFELHHTHVKVAVIDVAGLETSVPFVEVLSQLFVLWPYLIHVLLTLNNLLGHSGNRRR